MRRYYEAELIPQCIAMGISYDEFWSLTPRTLNVCLEGYKLRRKIEDEKSWLLGGYVFDAVSLAVNNSFRKKGQKAKSYFEVVDKPFLKELAQNSGEITEDEKNKRLEALKAQLHIMKTNFDIKHGK